MTRREESFTGSARRKTAFTIVKTIVFAPMPRIRIKTETAVNPRLLLSIRIPNRKSCSNRSSHGGIAWLFSCLGVMCFAELSTAHSIIAVYQVGGMFINGTVIVLLFRASLDGGSICIRPSKEIP